MTGAPERARPPGRAAGLAAGLLAAWLAAGAVAGPALAQRPAPLTGRLVGLRCAQQGKIGECYLRWAEPMVLAMEGGDYLAIVLDPDGDVRPEQLDEAFGQDVEVRGRIEGGRLHPAALRALRPTAGKEFFKG